MCCLVASPRPSCSHHRVPRFDRDLAHKTPNDTAQKEVCAQSRCHNEWQARARLTAMTGTAARIASSTAASSFSIRILRRLPARAEFLSRARAAAPCMAGDRISRACQASLGIPRRRRRRVLPSPRLALAGCLCGPRTAAPCLRRCLFGPCANAPLALAGCLLGPIWALAPRRPR